MPQCQRSPNNTILEAQHEEAPGIWRCPGEPFSPGCPGGETYRLATRDRVATLAGFDRALEACRREFGREPRGFVSLWMGVRPLTISNLDGSIDIYVNAESDEWQLRQQCAHEAVHATCDNVIHWTHELLAVCFTARHLRTIGDVEYAQRYEADLRLKANLISTEELLAWNHWPEYPPAEIFGRVFAVGEGLIADTSWEDVKHLVSTDPDAWLTSLERPKRRRARRTLRRNRWRR